MKPNANNTLIGRKCIIDFACRWKDAQPQFQEQLKVEYSKRDDWEKTGEIVHFSPEDYQVSILRDDTGRVEKYYLGEITLTGPAPNPHKEIINLLTEIRDRLT